MIYAAPCRAMKKPKYWLIKSEPSVYPFTQLVRDGETAWTGVRNFEARNNLRAMSVGDLALYYHSGEGKEIVGVARISTDPGPDRTAPGEDWAQVSVEPVVALKVPVTLKQVKATPAFKAFPLITRSRLSVVPVSPEDFSRILKLGRTELPKRKR
jgi:predicted RNA-binding protein with PUA-like domain